jgi:hypothetical protein
VAIQFLRVTPLILLVIGIGLALLDLFMLYIAAKQDGVLHIPEGIGLLQDYGLFSTVFGNAILIYLARRYYEAVCSIRTSKAVNETADVEGPLLVLGSMVRMEGKYRFPMYLFIVIGAIFWAANVGVHLFGDPVAQWGHKVFDSKDHRLSFYASRLHNAYTWLLVLPLVGHVVIFASIQLRRVVNYAAQTGALRYDLLNPDQRGGFLFIERSHFVFNTLLAIVYVQITIHIGTFERMNAEHIVAYVLATLVLLFGNRIFLGDIYSMIDTLRLDALNTTKEKVYRNDTLSFEILKYCNERRVSRFSVVNLITKALAIAISAAVKFAPLLSKTFTSAGGNG